MATTQPRAAETDASANFQSLSSSGISQGLTTMSSIFIVVLSPQCSALSKCARSYVAFGRCSVGRLGLLPLPLGEGWGEGFRSIERIVTPSPQPSLLRGEGADRDRRTAIESHKQPPWPCHRIMIPSTSRFLSHHRPQVPMSPRRGGLAQAEPRHPRQQLVADVGHFLNVIDEP